MLHQILLLFDLYRFCGLAQVGTFLAGVAVASSILCISTTLNKRISLKKNGRNMKFSYLLITYLKHSPMSMDLIDNNVKKFYNFINSIVQF